MSIVAGVGLLSGRKVIQEAGLTEKVDEVKARAQSALGVGKGRLLDPSGFVLDECKPITAVVQNGDLLTFHVGRVQVCGSACAFAATLGDGTVVTWGDTEGGGDSSAVQDQLNRVKRRGHCV